MIQLEIPLTESAVRGLKLGDIVYITGTMFTGRTSFHTLVLENKWIVPPEFAAYNVMAHCGPVMKKGPSGQWIVVNAGGTTSNRMERYGGEIIKRLGIRAIIGKGTMGPGTMKVMKEFGAVHLTTNMDRVGFRPFIEEVVGVYNLETLGATEATWVFRVKECGPFVVDIDASGNNLFDNVHEEVMKSLMNK